MLAIDMPKSRQWMPLRLKTPVQRKLRHGIIAACILPWSAALIFFLFLVHDSGSLNALAEQIKRDPIIFWVIMLPLFGVFTLGAFLVAFISARSVMRRSHIRMLALLWTGLRTALFIHGITALFQMAAFLSGSYLERGEFGFMLRDLSEFFQIHLTLALFATTPLALLCTYIFRMVALTRKPDQVTAAFE